MSKKDHEAINLRVVIPMAIPDTMVTRTTDVDIANPIETRSTIEAKNIIEVHLTVDTICCGLRDFYIAAYYLLLF